MGDHADDANEDYFPISGFQETGKFVSAHIYSPKDAEVTCYLCGEGGLNWAETDSGKWWLKDPEGEWHKCKEPERKPMPTPIRNKKLYHIYTTADGVKLFSDTKVQLCECTGSLHKLDFECDV